MHSDATIGYERRQKEYKTHENQHNKEKYYIHIINSYSVTIQKQNNNLLFFTLC